MDLLFLSNSGGPHLLRTFKSYLLLDTLWLWIVAIINSCWSVNGRVTFDVEFLSIKRLCGNFCSNRVQNICLYMNQLIAPRISLWIQEAFHFSHILIPYFIVIAHKWSVQIFLRTWNSFSILYLLYLTQIIYILRFTILMLWYLENNTSILQF